MLVKGHLVLYEACRVSKLFVKLAGPTSTTLNTMISSYLNNIKVHIRVAAFVLFGIWGIQNIKNDNAEKTSCTWI